MKIHEPTTTLTDFLIAGCAGWFSWRLLTHYDSTFHVWWGIVFLTIAAGAFLGALRHGWGPRLGTLWSDLLNKGTYAMVGLTAVSMIIATLLYRYSYRVIVITSVLLAASWLVYVFIAFRRMTFAVVICYYFPALIITLMLNYGFHQSAGAIWIMAGIVISLMAGGVQVSGISLHRHFNHNDLYHVIQLIGLFALYHGVRII